MKVTINLTVPELAQASGVSVRTMYRRLRELREHGKLTTKRRGPGRPAYRTLSLTRGDDR